MDTINNKIEEIEERKEKKTRRIETPEQKKIRLEIIKRDYLPMGFNLDDMGRLY